MSRITKRNTRPVIILDYDDVLFDFLGVVIQEYNKRMNTKPYINLEDVTSWDLSKVGNIHVFKEIIRDAELWRKMPEKDNAMQVVQSLINDGRYNILICTACGTIEEYKVKVEIIENKLPSFDIAKIVNLTDKHLIRGDFLVDDKIENCEKCSPYMKCYLMDMPHNRNCNQFPRLNSLNDLPQILEEVF